MRAPFLRRGLARALDIAVHLIVLEGAARVAHLLPQGSLLQLSERALLGVDMVVGTSAFLLYPALSEWIGGATLGKVAFRVRVVDAEDPAAPLRLRATLKRNLALFVDLLIFGIIAYSAMQRSPRRQRVGDAWAGTVVVHQEAALARPVHRGWSLGLLVAFALVVISYVVAS